MNFSVFLLQAPGGAGITQLLLFAAMGIVFWLFLVRPQAKRQREQADFLKNLSKGDDVVTASGIIGKVNKIEDNTITLEVGKLFIPITRNAISKEMTDAYFATENKA
ncbi:MAG: preprotein translocase subunit YajC [Bacteroidetes bacterium]|nr:MAG: preprotein translocase subunit YajC [Bacteroidota bacterium]PTM12552.1 MAG: preprotein translocase subunit YajC [Bacteroidota bacterium]